MLFPNNPTDGQKYKSGKTNYVYVEIEKCWKKEVNSIPTSVLKFIDVEAINKLEQYNENTNFNNGSYFNVHKRNPDVLINQFINSYGYIKNTLSVVNNNDFNNGSYFNVHLGLMDFTGGFISNITIKPINTAEFSESKTLKSTLTTGV